MHIPRDTTTQHEHQGPNLTPDLPANIPTDRNSVISADPYSISPGNTVGPIVTSSNVATNNTPHANYVY